MFFSCFIHVILYQVIINIINIYLIYLIIDRIIIYNCICMLIAYYIILYILGVYKYIIIYSSSHNNITVYEGTFEGIRHSRIYTFRKNFDCKKCPVHLVSFIKHHGLFVPYIVDIFDCKKCHTDLVSFTKHHGLFVPYIVDIFIFLIKPLIHSPIPRVLNFF